MRDGFILRLRERELGHPLQIACKTNEASWIGHLNHGLNGNGGWMNIAARQKKSCPPTNHCGGNSVRFLQRSFPFLSCSILRNSQYG
jgi:acyl CoA:acetate/3-ketoacid CoA transferase beta subunit